MAQGARMGVKDMQTLVRDQVHFAFSPDNVPVYRAHSGDTVLFQCQDCYAGQLTEDGQQMESMNMAHNNPATGPLYIEEAVPGDVLRVEILSIQIAKEGSMCAREGAGIYGVTGCHCRRFPVEGEEMVFDKGIRVPLRPMIGVIGVAPAEGSVPTTVPGEHGGNLDIRDMNEGAVLYLPVNVPGALLSMGDLHGVQGDGETVICALEVPGEVTVRVTVLKDREDIPTPFLVTKDRYLATAADPSLDVCSVKAARKMQRFLQDHAGLSPEQAGMLLSLAGNLRISQVVNPAKGCIMELPRGLAKESFTL